MDSEFSAKWGVQGAPAQQHLSTWHVLVGEFVLIFMVLWIMHPGIVMTAREDYRPRRTCFVKLLVLTTAAVAITYFWPSIRARAAR